MDGTATRPLSLGHLALYYLPGDMAPARRLFERLGCTLVENGPDPGRDGFCTVLLDAPTGNYADNLLFLAQASPAQVAVEEAVTAAWKESDGDASPYTAFRELRRRAPEVASHLGIRYGSFEALEDALLGIETDAREGGPLHGRVELTRYRARRGLDPAVDARMDASSVFTGDEPEAFADHWVQCFVTTDLCAYGIVAFGQTIELDFVFEPFFAAPPSFGRRRP
jgi:hypothetical protein